MRWWSLPIVVAIGWFLYTLTPYWALYDLARAVQSGDAAYVESHVNFRTLRFSLVRQLTAALRAGGGASAPKDRQRIADAASALALPLAETLVTPRVVVDLLDDGWPQGLDLPDPRTGEGLRIPDPRRLADYYLAAEMRGFRTVVVAVPPGRPRAEQFKIRMRLRNWTWHLVEIELTETVKDRIAASLARSPRARHPDRNAPGEAASDPAGGP